MWWILILILLVVLALTVGCDRLLHLLISAFVWVDDRIEGLHEAHDDYIVRRLTIACMASGDHSPFSPIEIHQIFDVSFAPSPDIRHTLVSITIVNVIKGL